jgi:starvation-inducible outer membrane lipoprotein
MKKIILLISLFTVFGCTKNTKKGSVNYEPQDFIIIHNKTYKLMSVVPRDGYNSIWIMYPKDSTDSQPQVINYNVKQGKTQVNQTVIKVD